MSKLIAFVLIVLIFINCKQETQHGFSVRKWLLNDSKLSNKRHLLAFYSYDKNGNPLTITNYSRSGSNMIDSISFIYNATQSQVEVFHFRPSSSVEKETQSIERTAQLLFVKNPSNLNYYPLQKGTNSDLSYYLQWFNNTDANVQIKDTLNLLQGYILTVDNVISVSKELGFAPIQPYDVEGQFQYSIRFKPSILLEYGISFDEELYSMNYSIKNKLLVGDEFQFEKHNVRRIYFYENGLITKVEIFVLDKVSNKEMSFTELFEYSKLSTP